MNIVNLWGAEFKVEETAKKTKKILDKISNAQDSDIDPEKLLKSKKTSLEDKLAIITKEVLRILGHYKENTLIIRSKQQLIEYIDECIKNKIIAIDTETNNSLDPITCKLMGACIYTPTLKQAYVPVNHRNFLTKELLDNQVTEQDIKEQFDRLNQNNVKILTHNGKFDYEVLHCTCNYDMKIYWDSYVAARMLDENEPSAGLKQQYIDKINSEQEKYDIEYLFNGVEYADVDPDIFALYSATDAYMTYKLYEWQVEKFKDPDLKNIYNLYQKIEIPVTIALAKMELRGVYLDLDYCKCLSEKYHKLSQECDDKINKELVDLEPKIAAWKSSPEALNKTIDKKGKEAKKTKLEQLDNPISLNSPAQLAILLYDILKAPIVNTESPRGTGVEELNKLYEKTNLELLKTMLEKRTLDKLVNTFVDKMPQTINPKDKRVHAQFFNVATDTARFSSSNPNLQNLPRDYKDIRPMFGGTPSYEEIKEITNNILVVDAWDDIEVENNEYVKANKLKINDKIQNYIISDIIKNDYKLKIVLKSVGDQD